MKKQGHIIFAVVLGFIFVYLSIYFGFSELEFSWKSASIICLITVFYSLLPDIDHKGSSITHFFFGIGILGIIISLIGLFFKFDNFNPLMMLVISTVFLVLTYISSNFLGHRGVIHSVQAGIIAVLPIYFLFHSIVYSVAAYIAWHSHLLGDGFLFKIKQEYNR